MKILVLDNYDSFTYNTAKEFYQIIEYDMTKKPWIELRRKDILNISVKGVQWLTGK